MRQRKALLFKILLITVSLCLIGVAIVVMVLYQNQSAKRFVKRTHVPYEALIPTKLPDGSLFASSNGESYYQRGSHLLVLDWVFPAETLPGQGSLYIYQTDKLSRALPIVAIGSTQTLNINGNKVSVTIGQPQNASKLPINPSRLVATFNDRGINVGIVSYAISRDFLRQIISSLRFYD